VTDSSTAARHRGPPPPCFAAPSGEQGPSHPPGTSVTVPVAFEPLQSDSSLKTAGYELMLADSHPASGGPRRLGRDERDRSCWLGLLAPRRGAGCRRRRARNVSTRLRQCGVKLYIGNGCCCEVPGRGVGVPGRSMTGRARSRRRRAKRRQLLFTSVQELSCSDQRLLVRGVMSTPWGGLGTNTDLSILRVVMSTAEIELGLSANPMVSPAVSLGPSSSGFTGDQGTAGGARMDRCRGSGGRQRPMALSGKRSHPRWNCSGQAGVRVWRLGGGIW